ncbi:MAG: 2OG-Fe(II) oxygenase [Pseudohongiellaceae bacterium]|nr:2OG-Fe(II) oxygenase [Pseudohongiellaceae bacterium]
MTDTSHDQKSANTLRQEYPLGKQIAQEPIVQVIDDYLNDDEIATLIAAGEDKLEPAKVSSATGGITSKGRSGRNFWLPHGHNETVKALCLRLAELVQLPLNQAESLQLIHYFESQEYAPHFDAWDANTEAGQRCMKRGGQRLITCLLYLNDVDEGGGTIFPKLKQQVEAKKGRLVIFHSCYPGTTIRHPHSLHGGMPVIRGEKWACNLWFRERDYY